MGHIEPYPRTWCFVAQRAVIRAVGLCVLQKSQSKDVQPFEDQDNPQRKEKNDHRNEKNWALSV